jgi:hypothetical protein
MSLSALGPRVSKAPEDLVIRVQEATELAIASSPIDDKDKEPEVSMDKSESVVSSEGPALPADKPYWVPDELPVPPPVDETAPSPSTPPPPDPEEESSGGQIHRVAAPLGELSACLRDHPAGDPLPLWQREPGLAHPRRPGMERHHPVRRHHSEDRLGLRQKGLTSPKEFAP